MDGERTPPSAQSALTTPYRHTRLCFSSSDLYSAWKDDMFLALSAFARPHFHPSYADIFIGYMGSSLHMHGVAHITCEPTAFSCALAVDMWLVGIRSAWQALHTTCRTDRRRT